VRSFRFAFGGSAKDRAGLIEQAQRAEALGYSTYLIADHLLDQFGPVPALTAVAMATTRLRLGTFVLNNDLRHPAVLAQDLATLDALSEGRLDIGLGAGWNAEEYTGAGLTFDRHGVRFERMRESMQVLKGLFGDGPFSFQGRFYQITDMDGRPKPHQRPHPPFMLGGGGRRMLTLAAQEAQIVGLAPRIPTAPQPDIRSALAEATGEKVAWIREAAGPRFDSLELNTYTALGPVQVTDNALAAARAVADRLEQRYGVPLTAEELLDSPHAFIGTVPQLVEKCLALRERFNISYIFAFGALEEFAPVVQQLAER
jgi:probable F420-dependent oxidoreductase